MKAMVIRTVLVALVLLPVLPVKGTSPPIRDVTFFLRRLRTLDHLPELEGSHTAMASTWDRSGGNFDGWNFKRVEDGRNILLDVDGPGCVHRIFTGWLGEGNDILNKPGPAGTHIQVFLDHAEQPVFDMPVEFQRNIRVAEETMGADALWMKGDTIIHRDHPIWSSTAFWYAKPAQPASSTPDLIAR
jgi:hypothetical protein